MLMIYCLSQGVFHMLPDFSPTCPWFLGKGGRNLCETPPGPRCVCRQTPVRRVGFFPAILTLRFRSVSLGETERAAPFPKTDFLFMLTLVLLTLFFVGHWTP